MRGESHSGDPHDGVGRTNGSLRLSRRAGRTALEGTTVLQSVETEMEMSIPAYLDKYPSVMWAKECKIGASLRGTCKEGCNSTVDSTVDS